MKYKNRGSIPFFKFKAFTESIEGANDKIVIKLTERAFKCDVIHFAAALKNTKNIKLGYKLNLKFPIASKFIDCDTFLSDKNELDFFKLVLKKKWFGKNIEDISVAEAEFVLGSFYNFSKDIKSKYEYLYNPPLRIQGETTQGSLERKAFAEHYGGYMEMVYTLCKGDFTKFEEIVNWDLDKFLFQAEYLIRKKDIENIK